MDSKQITINEHYIAGFFDGEGYIAKDRALIVMTNTEKSIIDETSQYLKNHNIENVVITEQPKNNNYLTAYRLRVYGIKNVKKFIDLIPIRHPDKLVRVRELYNDSRICRYKKLLRLRSQGLTFRAMGKIIGVAYGSIYRQHKRAETWREMGVI